MDPLMDFLEYDESVPLQSTTYRDNTLFLSDDINLDQLPMIATTSSEDSSSSSFFEALSPEEDILVSNTPYENSPNDSPNFLGQENQPLTLEEQATFQELVNELYSYGSNAADPQAFAQALMTPQAPVEYVLQPSSPEESNSDSSTSKKRKRVRKRTKKEDGPAQPTAVSLPREKLLVISSKEMQQYVEELRRTRELTSEEEKDLKRQKRLIKNRESALASRTRKKAHVEELQQQIAEIQNEKKDLADTVSSLSGENDQLKQQVVHLQNIVRKTSFLAELWSRMTKPPSKEGATNYKTATACLFVILFTFGLFFDPLRGPLYGHQALEKPFTNTLASSVSFLDDLSANTQTPQAAANIPSFNRGSHRKLLSEEDEVVVPPFTASSAASSSSSSTIEPPARISAEELFTRTAEVITSTLAEEKAEEKPEQGAEPVKNNNSSYFLCTVPQTVTFETEGDNVESATLSLPTLVSFLVPAELIRRAMLGIASQISCQLFNSPQFTSSTTTTTTTTTSRNY